MSRHVRRALSISPQADPLVRECVAIMNAEKKSVREVMDRSGVSPFTFRQWRGQRLPKVRDLQAVLNSLGYELCIQKRAG